MISPFEFRTNPKWTFGAGKFSTLADEIAAVGSSVLIVRGSFAGLFPGKWDRLLDGLETRGVTAVELEVHGEPSPELVDDAAAKYRRDGVHCVAAIGGGSVLDAGKAISAMIAENGSVTKFLEGPGAVEPSGVKVPFFAVPTTAGTGSEATKNAVLSRVGPDGFKRSLRHDAYIPDLALVDPELTVTCSPEVTAATGLDAFSQLLEAYLSTKASRFTDAVCESGLRAWAEGFEAAWKDGNDIEARTAMSYAAYLSGAALANAGLGLVHGVAGTVGARFEVPHGVICGTLAAEVNRATVAKLREEGNDEVLDKYAVAGMFLTGEPEMSDEEAAGAVAEELDRLIELTGIPKLGEFGVKQTDADLIAAASGLKNHPVIFTKEEIAQIIAKRI